MLHPKDNFTFMVTLNADRVWVPPLSGKCVAYLRRSTRPHGRLNVSAQREAIARLVRRDYARIVAEFEEEEPLTNNWRRALEEAVRVCQAQNATLVIGQIERMRSAVQWLAYVKDRGVKFRGADAPHINNLSYNLLVVADLHWRKEMSRKVKVAHASAKASGKTIGGDRGHKEGLLLGPAKSAEVRRERADRRDSRILHDVRQIQHRGVTSLSGIATRLNQMGSSAPRGGQWSAAQVRRVIEKFADEADS